MSLMYKDELDELKIQWQNAYEQYKEDAQVLNNRIYHAQSEYDNAISVLNAERNDLRSEIRLLYNFLGGLEGACPGPRITPFDFVRERPANRDSDSIEYNGNEACDIQIKSIEKGIVKNALKYGGVALIGGGPIGIGAMGAFDFFRSRSKNKKQYEDCLLTFENQKIKWKDDLNTRREIVKLWELVSRMAGQYHGCIATVKDTIQDTIIPELGLVKAFLYANSIQEAIICDDSISNITATEIQVLQNTPFDVHYQFVRNVFDYYTLISSFFRQTVLTDIISDCGNTDQKEQKFNRSIEDIRNKTKNIKNYSVINR